MPITPPLEDAALVDFFGTIVAGITGLDANSVFPAWQQDMPNLPAVGTTWAAIRVTERQGDPYAAEIHNPGVTDPAGFQGSDTILRQEVLTLECSFYGPAADGMAALFRDGLSVAQNREAMRAANFGFMSVGQIQAIPSLVKEKWLYRAVLTATFRRQIERTYPVLDLKSAAGTVDNGAMIDAFDTTLVQGA